jgi:hypothetical protein
MTSFIIPALTGPYIAYKPLSSFLAGITCRLGGINLSISLIQYYGTSDTPFYDTAMFVLVCNEAASSFTFESQMSFFSRISRSG